MSKNNLTRHTDLIPLTTVLETFAEENISLGYIQQNAVIHNINNELYLNQDDFKKINNTFYAKRPSSEIIIENADELVSFTPQEDSQHLLKQVFDLSSSNIKLSKELASKNLELSNIQELVLQLESELNKTTQELIECITHNDILINELNNSLRNQ